MCVGQHAAPCQGRAPCKWANPCQRHASFPARGRGKRFLWLIVYRSRIHPLCGTPSVRWHTARIYNRSKGALEMPSRGDPPLAVAWRLARPANTAMQRKHALSPEHPPPPGGSGHAVFLSQRPLPYPLRERSSNAGKAQPPHITPPLPLAVLPVSAQHATVCACVASAVLGQGCSCKPQHMLCVAPPPVYAPPSPRLFPGGPSSNGPAVSFSVQCVGLRSRPSTSGL